jgi:3-deoxy-D-manno-octulosonic-acid transferase
MYLLYSALMATGLLLSLPYWMLARRHGRWREGLGERLGRVPVRLRTEVTPAIWVHAVSVGEVLAVSELVKKLSERFPEHRVLVSTTTATGQNLARKHFGEDRVFYFPLDLPFAIRPYLSALRPQLIVLAETEFWPNFLRLAHTSGARVAVVNARISDRSWPGYRRFRPVLRKILQGIDLFLAQTEEDATRLRDIGGPVDRVQVSGNLKFDVVPTPAPPIVANLRSTFQQSTAGPIIVCGSTMEGEERILLLAFQNVLASHPMALMILAPRRPERFEEVAGLLQQLGIRFWRRSSWTGDAIASGVW